MSAELKREIGDLASAIGFDAFGVARAAPLDGERERLRAWLAAGRHGTMHYLERLESERLDPDALLPGAKSVLCFAHSYAVDADVGEAAPQDPAAPRIARYARGRDYHKVLRTKLRRIAEMIGIRSPDAESRICVDTAPILEKAWAERCGLGLAGEAHEPGQPRPGLVDVSRHASHHGRAPARRAAHRLLRELSPMSRRVSHVGVSRAVRDRRHPMYLVSHHRTSR